MAYPATINRLIITNDGLQWGETSSIYLNIEPEPFGKGVMREALKVNMEIGTLEVKKGIYVAKRCAGCQHGQNKNS